MGKSMHLIDKYVKSTLVRAAGAVEYLESNCKIVRYFGDDQQHAYFLQEKQVQLVIVIERQAIK